MKLVALVAVPPGVVMVILPVTAPAGTAAVTCVLEFTVKAVAAMPPNFTALVCDRLMPVITTEVPTVPLGGVKPVIVGMIRKLCSEVRFPLGSLMVTAPVVAPAIILAVM